jgi:hypothetical protein
LAGALRVCSVAAIAGATVTPAAINAPATMPAIKRPLFASPFTDSHLLRSPRESKRQSTSAALFRRFFA